MIADLIVLQGGAVSVWHDPKQEMKHTLYAYHELQPPMHSDAFGVRAAVLDLIPAIPATQKQLDAKSGSRSAVLVSVMMHGQFWKWSLPMPDLPTEVVPTQKKQLSRGVSSQAAVDPQEHVSLDPLLKAKPLNSGVHKNCKAAFNTHQSAAPTSLEQSCLFFCPQMNSWSSVFLL
jgi:hypothetical protein